MRLRHKCTVKHIQYAPFCTGKKEKLRTNYFLNFSERTENRILLQTRKVSILFICPANSATSTGTCFFVFLRESKASPPMLAHRVLKLLVLPLIQKSAKTQN